MSNSLVTLLLSHLIFHDNAPLMQKIIRSLFDYFTLKKAYCIVVNDLNGKNSELDLEFDKFFVYDVEKVYLNPTILTDRELANVKSLKETNPERWLEVVRKPFKMLYDNARRHWRNETMVVKVSNREVAKMLKIPEKRTKSFVADKDMKQRIEEWMSNYL